VRKQRIISLCLASLLALSLAACNSPTDEQNSAQPTPSTQPTAAPTPTPTPPIPFTDVAQDSPYYDAVVWAYKNGIASDGETFGPADACTRGQVMTFLWRAKGSPEPQAAESPFSDVSSDDWFYKPALWASENGIATGTAFNPGNPCTSAEALTFLWRAEGKPAASVYNSAMALAASGQYYTRPAAWAEANGLFARTEFDPAAPCSRADLMAYLYWATEEWTFAEEDKAVQAEYEQIINDAQLYEVHGSGLCYADYVDVDNDDKVELLTVSIGENAVIVTAYVNDNGHVKKYCERVFSFGSDCGLYLCTYDNHIYLHMRIPLSTPDNVFYKIENGAMIEDGAFVLDDLFESGDYYRISDEGGSTKISEAEYNSILEKSANERALLGYSFNGVSIFTRGLAPSPEEYTAARAEQSQAEHNQINAAGEDRNRIVFSGTLGVYSYSEVLALQQISDPNPGDHDETFWIIVLDTPQNMALRHVADESKRPRDREVRMVDVTGAEGIKQYAGQHITVSIDGNNTWCPSDTSLPLGEPRTNDVRVLAG